jgi:circadian clock protein KaiB
MARKSTRRRGGRGDSPEYRLRLFVAGDEPNSAIARASLDRIRLDYPEQRCQVEIVDVLKDFRPALDEKIPVTPALVIRGPERRVVIFGNLADTGKVLAALQVESESV